MRTAGSLARISPSCRVPSTINALLAARLESLSVDERAILTTAAVEGAVFHRSAVAELAQPSLDAVLDNGLLALVRRDLIRLDASDSSGEKAYRFRHVLIRDAAYHSLSKNDRADLHERFADWLEIKPREHLRELDEIVGYHLEQAFQCRVALGARDSRAALLAAQAAARLEAAARRALARGHLSAAIALLQRVCVLLTTDDPRKRMLLPELAAALIECGRLAEADRVLEEAERLAATANDERAASHVLVRAALSPAAPRRGGRDRGSCAGNGLGDPGIRALRGQSWLMPSTAARSIGSIGTRHAPRRQQRRGNARPMHARLAGDRHLHNEILTWIASSLWFGPTPADDGIRRCEANARGGPREPRVRGGDPPSPGRSARDGWPTSISPGNCSQRAMPFTPNSGFTLDAAMSQNEAVVELLAGNPAAAEESLRTGIARSRRWASACFRSTTAAFLARAVLEQGRDEEAEDLAKVSAQLAAKGDLLSQILWRGVRARVLARRAQFEEAESLAREAVALAQSTDFVNHRADALLDFSQVLEGFTARRRGRHLPPSRRCVSTSSRETSSPHPRLGCG